MGEWTIKGVEVKGKLWEGVQLEEWLELGPMKTPWHVNLPLPSEGFTIQCQHGFVAMLHGDYSWPNAHRIVACVNALAGVENPSVIPKIMEFLEEIDLLFESETPSKEALQIRSLLKEAKGKK